MPVESALYLSDLDVSRPAADDPVAEGAPHLRLLKTVLKTTFPNINAAVTATDEEINSVVGLPARTAALEANRVRIDIDQTLAGNLNTAAGKYLFENGVRAVPVGVIVMWGGLVANIPTGWRLCDGSNGTPDLRDRFVIGAGGTLSPGATPGSNTGSITTTAAGSHSHTGATVGAGNHTHTASTDAQGAHMHGGATNTHALTVDQIPPHTHSVDGIVVVAGGGGIQGGANLTAGYGSVTTGSTGSGATHAHGIPVDGAHAHNVTVNAVGDHAHAIVADGSHTHSATFDNRPASFALCYIMRV